MRFIHSAAAALLAFAGGDILAQTCTNPNRLSAADIQAALGNQWFCAQKAAGDPNQMWRQFIPNASSGTFQECHSGLSTGPDPKDPNKGTFTIAGQGSVGTLSLSYPPAGGTSTYWVCNGSSAGQYVFRDLAGGANSTAGFFVYISTCPSGGISTAQKTNCPP